MEVIISVLIAYSTSRLSYHPHIGVIRSSTLITLTSYLLLLTLLNFFSFDLNYYIAAIFGATFVGMTRHEKINFVGLTLASVLYGLLFIYLVPRLVGFGGALGFSAFLAVIFAIGIDHVVHKIKDVKA